MPKLQSRSNPIKDWRGHLSITQAAEKLGIARASYYALEQYPPGANITIQRILKVSAVTHIPQQVLISYFAKEAEPC